MLKKVDSSQLKVGMYIHDLSCDWMTHPFVRNRFLLTTHDEIRKILNAGIHDVVIDSSKGLDVQDAPSLAEAQAATEREIVEIVAKAPVQTRVSLGEEMQRAVQIRHQASTLVRTVMQDARLGKAIELDQVQPVVQNITESILRNPGALVGLLRIKNKDDYTFLHSVSVCTLLVAFCRSRNLPADVTHQAGLGGLLHDTGKALVPDAILNKPGPLTDEEFAIIKKHPEDGYKILKQTPEIGPIPLDITLHHHERRDGSGYPSKQADDGISELAQMAAIVDVYDAITADRCYHKGMSAAAALRKIYEWSKFHFNPTYAQEFMRCVGIYPVGTMVLLESGRLGVVVEPHETNLLAPKVNVFFHTKKNVYIKPETVDLSRGLGFGGGDKIVGHESPAKWNVDPMRFLSVA
ncbi:HD-GYP domain-containing protein [Duganella dendranthematis]|jgi:HD-GYP domain-containing protein (c-di-GMP phosphodiesterase class II)|uniref:HD-GYP domain-containing protein n=1 Tax=Duganella dendranthematis TaxID=2728021 RepID=A0ABX6M9N9_9BURK|nr:HD-GYP domain-containing protein [Duganella dendranthematis]QJD90781.1 HD-GYP domain-containing protein [Duganella dendranthematis]